MARRLAAARPGAVALAGARRRARTSPTIRSSAAAARCWRPTSRREQLKFEFAGPDRRPKADGVRLVQLPPRPLRVRLRHRDRRRRASPTPPAWASASSASCSPCCSTHGLDLAGWPDEVRDGSSGDDDRPDARARACPVRTRRPTGPHPLHGAEPHLAGDQLLHRPAHRAAARLRLRAAGRASAITLRDRLRGRPVDVLQAAAGGPRAALRDRHPRAAALPAAARAHRRADRRGADDHRRARQLVPARHRGAPLPARARQDLGRR